jgi:hypothetical protein
MACLYRENMSKQNTNNKNLKTMKNFKHLSRVIALLLVIGATSFSASANSWFDIEFQDWSKRENIYKIDNAFSNFVIRSRGKIQVTDDDKDISSISADGYLIVEKSSFGSSRRLEISSENGKVVTRKYFEGSKERDYEPNGRIWLEEVMKDAIYKIGVGGKERAHRIYKAKGLSGFLNEIELFNENSSFRISSSFLFSISEQLNGVGARNLYFKTLVDEIKFDKRDLPQVLKAISDISSNSTKGTILRTILDKYTLEGITMSRFLKTTQSLSYNTERGNVLRKFQSMYKISSENSKDYFDVINSIGINSEKGNVLKPLLNTQKLDDQTMIELIRSVGQFSSDSEKAAVLRVVAAKMSDKSEVVREYIRVSSLLADNYSYLRDELLEIVAKNGAKPNQQINKSGVMSLLSIAQGYRANTPKTVTLRKVNASLGNDSEIIDRYFNVVYSLDNSMEQYALMIDLIYSHKLDAAVLKEVLRIAEVLANKDFKHGATAILREAIPLLPADGSLHKEFFDALERIDHVSGKEEIVRMFCQKWKLDQKLTVHLLSVVEDMEVDVEKATSLILIHKNMPKDDNLKYIFDSTTKRIQDDYDYEKVILAIK